MPSAGGRIRRKDMDFLSNEAASWAEAGIITQEQAEDILSLYEVKTGNLRAVMLTAGAVLLGMGAASFMMAHWHELDKVLRVCIISAAYLASLAAYIFTGRETKLGKSFLLLASGIFGAGIYLITRMYDYPLEPGGFLGLWITEAVLTSVIARDEWQMYLAQALSLIWMNETGAVNAFALYFVRTARIPVTEFFVPLSAFALIGALWLSWLAVKDRAALMLNMLLTLLLLASRMSLCFGGTWSLIILACSGAVMSLALKHRDAEILGLLMLGVSGLLLSWPDFWRGHAFISGRNVYPVINAVIVAALMLVNIWRGHHGIGVTFCALLAARYFFDHLFGFLPKAWGFTVTGIIFAAAGIFFGRTRRFFVKE